MAKIDLNIVATGEFSQVTTQIKALQAQVDVLNKSVAGVGVGAAMAKDMQLASAAFKSTMLSTGQFTMSTVKMTSETEKFGQALTSGKLRLSEYFQIITGKSGQATASLAALTAEQVKLQESVVMTDPTRKGFLQVYTPTTINSVTAATKMATMQQNLYNLSIESGSKSLINWGKNTQWAGRQLTVGLTMPMVLFGAAAVKSFKDVNTELTRLQRLYGEGLTPPSQKELDQISNQVLNLGKQIAGTMGIAQTETVKAAANFAAMGRQGKDLLDTTAQTMRLSKLGAVSTADATNTVVALQNVYKVSTMDLAGAVNFLSDIQKQTTMTLGDMTQAIPRVGPIMQQLGGTYKDTAVMLVAMREAGVPAAQAANALKSAVASMIAPTAAASKEWLQYGINLSSIKDTTQGNPVQMITALQKGLQNLSPLVREQLIDKLFGKFQFARISALLDNFGKTGSQTVNALKIANATQSELATLANQEMKQATESTSAKWQRAMESFKATLYPIGQEFLKIGTIILDIANKVSKAFSGLPGPVKTVLGIMAGFALFAGPVIMLTGLLANFGGYILKTVVGIKQLATGGKSFRELLTPEIIASTNAAQLFDGAISSDVGAVDLLNIALKNLTVTIESMNAAMAATGAGGLAGLTKNVETAMSAKAMSQPFLPGFANGVFSLQAGGPKGKDTIPALIGRGESVVSAPMTEKHAGLLKAIIDDKVPGFDSGVYGASPLGNVRGSMDRRVGNWITGQEESGIPFLLKSGSGSTGAYGKSNFTFAQQYSANSGHQPFGINSISSSDRGQVANGYASTIMKSAGTSAYAIDKEIAAWQQQNHELMQQATNALRNGVDATTAYAEISNKFTTDMQAAEGPVSKFMSEAERMYPQLSADLEEAQQLATQYNLDLTKAADSARLLAMAPNNIAAQTMNTRGDFQALAATRNAATAMYPSNYAETGVPRILGTGVRTGDPIYGAFTSQGHVSKNALQEENLVVQQSLRDIAKAAEAQAVEIPKGIAVGMVRGSISSNPQVREAALITIQQWKTALGIASPSEVAAEQIGVPIILGVEKGMQQALPGLEAAGAEVATSLTTSMNEKIISNGSEMHMLLLTQAGEIVNTSIEFNKAGRIIAEAEIAGYRQAMLPFEAYVQETLPGMVAAGAEAAAVRSSSAFGPLLPNGNMSLGKRENLVNGEVVKSPRFGSGATFGMSMGAMMAGSMVSGMGGGNNAIAQTAGSTLQSVGTAGMMIGMIPKLAAFGPYIMGGVAALSLAYSGVKLLIAAEEEHRAMVNSAFTLSTDTVNKFKDSIINSNAVLGQTLTDLNKIPDKKSVTVTITNVQAGVGFSASDVTATTNAMETRLKAKDSKNDVDAMFYKSLRDAQEKDADRIAKNRIAAMVQVGIKGQDAYNQVALTANAAGKQLSPALAIDASRMTRAQAVDIVQKGTLNAEGRETIKGINDQAYGSISADLREVKPGQSAPAGLGSAYSNMTQGIDSGFNKKIDTIVGAGTGAGQEAVFGSAINSSNDVKERKAALDSLKGSTLDSILGLDQFIAALDRGKGQSKLYAQQLTLLADGHHKLSDAVQALGRSGIVATASQMKGEAGKAAQEIIAQAKAAGEGVSKYLLDHPLAWKAVLDTVVAPQTASTLNPDGTPKGTGTGTGTDTATTFTGTTAQKAAEKAIKANLKQQDALLKSMKDQLSLQQKQTAEVKRQNDFAQKTFDLNTQMKTDMISGNYLGAAGLKQQISAGSVDFNAGTQQYKMQTQIDTMQSRADMFNQALADLTEAISNSSTALSKDVIAASKTSALKPSSVDTSIPSSSAITQNFVINGGDINAVHKTVTEATKKASGKSVATKFKAGVARAQ